MDLLMRCAGVPFFCCSLAYATENKLSSVSAGIVQDLSNGDAYWAASGKGAFLNGTPMHVYSGEPLYNILGLNISGADAGLLARLQPLFESYNHLRHFGANAIARDGIVFTRFDGCDGSNLRGSPEYTCIGVPEKHLLLAAQYDHERS